jgi:DNA excision repair protein ERCC-8
MNQLLFDRSTGNLSPQAFARLQISHTVHAIQPAPSLRFHGGEKEAARPAATRDSSAGIEGKDQIWAHQAGVNALSIDVENKM